MRTKLAILLGFAALTTGNAFADQDSDAIKQHGLPGHWAVRCQERPSAQNPHQFFVASPIGNSIEQLATGDPATSGVLLLSNVHILSPDQIAYTTTINGVLYNIMIAKSGNKHRTMDNVTSTGQAVTSHGIITATGAETFWLERCPD
jgi:hypothetical protein